MIEINRLFDSFQSAVNVNQGGFVPPQTVFTDWVNDISKQLLKEKFEVWQLKQSTTDSIYPFLKTVNLTVPRAEGLSYDIATLPADYAFFSSARIMIKNDTNCGCSKYDTVSGEDGKTCSADGKYIDPDDIAFQKIADEDAIVESLVRIIDNQNWGSVCSSYTKKPTAKKPAITIYGEGLKVFPKGVGIIILDYFKNPVRAVYNYTIGPEDTIIFNPTGSVNLEWPESMTGEFVSRLVQRYGLYTAQPETFGAGIEIATKQ